ncbi:MAG: hypothetical protein M3Q07_09860 [Pseudobdellovibrionaceae bacterium]|nr:hypothetical protein [Pseudobdellovibrionaceae bacterium]
MAEDTTGQILMALQRLEGRLDGLDRLVKELKQSQGEIKNLILHGDEAMDEEAASRPSVRDLIGEAVMTAHDDGSPSQIHPDFQKALDAAGVIEKKPQ